MAAGMPHGAGGMQGAVTPQGRASRAVARTGPMIELIRTNDIVLIGFAQSLLEEAGLPVLVADNHMSALEGSIGMFGRRLLVPDDWAAQARRLLTEAGLEAELRDA
jgi:hypothetical protein